MANRAYLYAKKGTEMIAISEYSYEIPIAYKILVSQNTKRAKSKVFKSPFKIALRGDFEKGAERLYAFLDELKKKGYFEENELKEKIKETKSFLEKHNDCDYFHLEGAEIYAYDSRSYFLSNEKMRKKILHIDNEIRNFYQEMDEIKKRYDKKYKKMSEGEQNSEGSKKLQKIKDEMMNSIGIQEWSDYLYYEI